MKTLFRLLLAFSLLMSGHAADIEVYQTTGSKKRVTPSGVSISTAGVFSAISATALSGVVPAANGGTGLDTSATVVDKFLYTSGTGTWATSVMTAFGRSLVDDVDAATARTTLGATTLGASVFTAADAPAAMKALKIGAPDRTIKTVVIFGDSTAYGVGGNAGVGHLSWAGGIGSVLSLPPFSYTPSGELSNILTGQGFQVYNVAQSGWNTGSWLSNTVGGVPVFEYYVASLRPDFVVYSSTSYNEGLPAASVDTDAEREAIFLTWVANTKTLIAKVRQIGAIPVWGGALPFGYVGGDSEAAGIGTHIYAAPEKNISVRFQKELEAMGVLAFDTFSPLDNGVGNWLPGSYGDVGHPSGNVGHLAIFSSIPVGWFTSQSYWGKPDFSRRGDAYLHYTSSAQTNPLHLVPDGLMQSFTLGLWYRGTVTGKTLGSAASLAGTNLMFSTLGGFFELIDLTSGHAATSAVAPDGAWHHVCMTYSAVTLKARFYLDGVQITTGTGLEGDGSILTGATVSVGPTDWSIGGINSDGSYTSTGDYRDLVLYRVPLTAEYVSRLAAGDVTRLSLEGYFPMDDRAPLTASSKLRNLAGTGCYLQINTTTSGWTSSGAPAPVMDFGAAGLTVARATSASAARNALGASSGVWPATVGGTGMGGLPKFSVHKNGTDQTITTSTNTKLAWSTEDYDSAGNFASDKFTPTVAGTYTLLGAVMWNGLGATGSAEVDVYKNGSLFKRVAYHVLYGTETFTQEYVVDVVANGSTDYFEVYVWQNTGSSGTVYGGSPYTYFQGHAAP